MSGDYCEDNEEKQQDAHKEYQHEPFLTLMSIMPVTTHSTPLREKSMIGYPCNTRRFRGRPLQSTQLSPMSYQIPAWETSDLTQNLKK